ncbi:hypothetical protein HK107_12895 [Parvularcula sp. ZS-1/3]|uniref:Peptidase M10 metallopeptidase domain-containing protein n=1 Tax=Parvularcula mediterranea TaxID=2732508 RepID=A0A7Y3RN90_9PROT|nr:hypothetical protein [Parvularcula mediterranea]NNU17222.1 hypothetical protein [Parvularcula mediterranea]
MKKLLMLTAAAATLGSTAMAQGGRQLDIIALPTAVVDVRGDTFLQRETVPIFWDERCASVEYTLNTAGLPNQFIGGPTVSQADTVAAIQAGLDRWNDNPASYIEMNITSERNLGFKTRAGGDFINEVTFLTASNFTALASSPSTSLLADSVFNPGDDLNGDGNSDVFDPAVEGRNTCFDADGDGDIEFPAGFYRAGTILDNDVQFNIGVLWETFPTNTGGVDIDAVSTHEFGHSHGHSHTSLNQISFTDGSSTTMFPFIDANDAQSELTTRTPHTDDLALSAFIYPEGSSDEGIAALQPGDISFEAVYDVIEGSVVRDGVNVSGAAITAIDENGERQVTGISGRALVFESATGALNIFSPESFPTGDFEMAVPKGTYTFELQALDGTPFAANRVSTNANIGFILGQQDFPQELFDKNQESDTEVKPAKSKAVRSGDSLAKAIDFVTNREDTVRNHDGALDFGGFNLVGVTSVQYAERFAGADVLAALDANQALVSGNILTGTFDASEPVRFDRVTLSLGKDDGEGGLVFERELKTVEGPLGEDGDYVTAVFNGAKGLAKKIEQALKKDPSLDVILVIEADALQIGASGQPPAQVRLDTSAAGTSYVSFNGAELSSIGLTNMMELRFVPN